MVILGSIALKLQKVQSVSILAILCKRRQEPFSKPKNCGKNKTGPLFVEFNFQIENSLTRQATIAGCLTRRVLLQLTVA